MSTSALDSRTDRDEREISERGRTVIAGRAVERLAGYAVTEIGNVGGSARRLMGVTVGGDDPDRAAGVRARVDETTVDLDVRLSVAYPNSVAQACDRVRAHLIRRVGQLTGLAVTRVDITVTALHGPDNAGRVR